MPTIQATSIGGKIIEKAKWSVESIGDISIGDIVHVNIGIKDEALAKAIVKLATSGCVIEREEDGTSVTVDFVVEKFTHLLSVGKEADLDSMAWVKPMNRAVEAVTLYLMDRDKCDPKFLAMVEKK